MEKRPDNLPGVGQDPRRLVGYLGRSGVVSARVRLFQEEHLRERGGRSRP